MITIWKTPIVATVEQVLKDLKLQLYGAGLLKEIKNTGSDLMCTCPFHANGKEHNPSCGVLLQQKVTKDKTYEAGTVHCYTCGYTADLPQFVADLLGLSKSGNKPQLRMFLQMINKDEKDKDKQVQLWERGLTDIKNLIGLAGEYGDLTKRDIKIKRSGAKGSLKTTYQYFPKDPSEMEIPEPQNLVGSLILDLDREDQIKAIEGRLQLNKGNNNDSNNDSGAGATRVF